MADLARGGESGSRVGRIVRTRIVFLVAPEACGTAQLIVVVDVAVGALARRHRM